MSAKRCKSMEMRVQQPFNCTCNWQTTNSIFIGSTQERTLFDVNVFFQARRSGVNELKARQAAQKMFARVQASDDFARAVW